jgi:hypothetical protein
MAIHKRHTPSGLAGKLKVERDPDGRLRVSDGRDRGLHPETIAQERPPQAPDPRPDVPPNVGPV